MGCLSFTVPRTTVDWDTSQADDFRTRGVPWTIKRTLERGRVTRSDRESLRSGARPRGLAMRRLLSGRRADALTGSAQHRLVGQNPKHAISHVAPAQRRMRPFADT
jgi:hypothetical protein